MLVYILFTRNKLTLRYQNGVYLYSSENLEVLIKIKWIFLILFSLLVIRNLRCACSSVEMLKGYIVTEVLGASALVKEGILGFGPQQSIR